MDSFNDVFELYDVGFKRLVAGNQLVLIIKIQHELETEKQLIEFWDQTVNLKMSIEGAEVFESNFNCNEVKHKKAADSDKSIYVTFHSQYDKEEHLKLIELLANDVECQITITDQDLFTENQGVDSVDIDQEV